MFYNWSKITGPVINNSNNNNNIESWDNRLELLPLFTTLHCVQNLNGDATFGIRWEDLQFSETPEDDPQ